MKGVFLHVLGDALGSVIVIISAVLYMTIPKVCEETVTALNSTLNNVTTECHTPTWVDYIDPILRLVTDSWIFNLIFNND